MDDRVFLDHPGPIPFAHRGGAIDFPENSMEAFAASVELGFRYLETDVHTTVDGHLVAFHDPSLNRTTDRSGLIAEMTWAEVRESRIDGSGTIPLFEQLLESWGHVRINVDPKDDRAVAPLVRIIDRLGATDRVCVGSFSDRRLENVRQTLGHAVCTGMGPRAIAKLRLASSGVPVGSIAGDCAQVPTHFRGVPVVTERFVAEAHRRNVAVHVWTIDDEPEMHRLLDMGVDGVMTDRPMALRSVLQSRGVWFEDH